MEAENKHYKSELNKNKIIVEYKEELYDLTGFISKHPGGKNFLCDRKNRNIDVGFKNAEHSEAAEYLMKEYKVQSKENDSEDLEHLVDWNKAMLPQISRLGKRYYKWVNSPVDRPLKIFQNDFLEVLTKSPWYLPLIFWIPVIFYCIHHDVSINKSVSDIYLSASIHFVLGMFIWTLLEYSLHRHVFHIDLSQNTKLNTFHFLLHGLHHKVPFDRFRLVFPPFPAAIIAIAFYQILRIVNFWNVIPHQNILMAGALTGYLCYDMTHYYIHHGNPYLNYFYHLKRYHYNHHFVNHEKGFGISNILWDEIFDTKIVLKKLNFTLRW